MNDDERREGIAEAIADKRRRDEDDDAIERFLRNDPDDFSTADEYAAMVNPYRDETDDQEGAA